MAIQGDNETFRQLESLQGYISMGKGSYIHPDDANLQEYTWEEIGKHCTKDDMWIAIEDYVYDVTKWSQRHPGGDQILIDIAGQDATVSSSRNICR